MSELAMIQIGMIVIMFILAIGVNMMTSIVNKIPDLGIESSINKLASYLPDGLWPFIGMVIIITLYISKEVM